MKNYTVLYASDPKQLVELVNQYLDQGYTCLGGVSASLVNGVSTGQPGQYLDGVTYLYQAVAIIERDK